MKVKSEGARARGKKGSSTTASSFNAGAAEFVPGQMWVGGGQVQMMPMFPMPMMMGYPGGPPPPPPQVASVPKAAETTEVPAPEGSADVSVPKEEEKKGKH